MRGQNDLGSIVFPCKSDFFQNIEARRIDNENSFIILEKGKQYFLILRIVFQPVSEENGRIAIRHQKSILGKNARKRNPVRGERQVFFSKGQSDITRPHGRRKTGGNRRSEGIGSTASDDQGAPVIAFIRMGISVQEGVRK